MIPDTDSITRVSARDLFLVLCLFENSPETTLENIRLRLCVDREKKRKGTFLWSSARDISGELQRLGLITGAPYPKDSRQYELNSSKILCVVEEGIRLIELFRRSRADAYDHLFGRMFARHPYMQAFVKVLRQKDIFAPVLSSLKDHVSSRYGATAALADDIIAGQFDGDSLMAILERRLQRPLTGEEATEIRGGLAYLTKEAKASALSDETSRFAKNFLNKLNDNVIPAIFRGDGLSFDFRTHRALWAMGQEFLLWGLIRSHPNYDGCLIYPTASIQVSREGSEVQELLFNSGLQKIRDTFLGRLHDAYQALQETRGTTFVNAWELRAVFCYDNRCQASVFNRLFGELANGSAGYRLHLEIQRQKPQHEEPLRAGNRNIGSIRVVRA